MNGGKTDAQLLAAKRAAVESADEGLLENQRELVNKDTVETIRAAQKKRDYALGKLGLA